MLRMLLKRLHFLRALLAMTVSELGTAFTSVAVYNELSKAHSGPLVFAIAFICGVLPGFLTSLFSGKRAATWPIGKILILGQFIGFLLLLFPLLGSFNHQVGFLLVAEMSASALSGLLLPIYKSFERASFDETDFPRLATLDTFLLTANFLFGQGLGSLLASQLTLREFLSIDAATYLLAIVILFPLFKVPSSIARSEAPSSLGNRLSHDQKRALCILPWLALVCAPLMVLLPARGPDFGASANVGFHLVMDPVLLLLCARSFGQLLGPFIASYLPIERWASDSARLSFSLAIYVGLYLICFQSHSLFVTALCCMLAHICSNVVYSVGNQQMLRSFEAHEIGWASAHVYRVMTVIMAVSSLGAGTLAQFTGFSIIPLFSVLFLIAGAIRLNWEDEKNVAVN